MKGHDTSVLIGDDRDLVIVELYALGTFAYDFVLSKKGEKGFDMIIEKFYAEKL